MRKVCPEPKPWIKIWLVDVLGDPRFLTLPDAFQLYWIRMWVLAGTRDRGDCSGRLEWYPGSPMSDEQVCTAIHVPAAEAEELLEAFVSRGMLIRDDDGTWVVADYLERQEPADKTAAARQQRRRDRMASGATGELPGIGGDPPTGPDMVSASGQPLCNALRHALHNGPVTPESRVEAEAEVDINSPPSEDSSAPAATDATAGGEPPGDAPPPPPARPEKVAPEWAIEEARAIARGQSELNPRYVMPSEARLRAWADHIERIHRIDKRPVEEVRRVREWAMAHEFWQRIIQSGEALRKHWNKITGQMEKGHGYGCDRKHAGSGGGAATALGHTPGMRQREVDELAERARRRYGGGGGSVPVGGENSGAAEEPGAQGQDARDG